MVPINIRFLNCFPEKLLLILQLEGKAKAGGLHQAVGGCPSGLVPSAPSEGRRKDPKGWASEGQSLNEACVKTKMKKTKAQALPGRLLRRALPPQGAAEALPSPRAPPQRRRRPRAPSSSSPPALDVTWGGGAMEERWGARCQLAVRGRGGQGEEAKQGRLRSAPGGVTGYAGPRAVWSGGPR